MDDAGEGSGGSGTPDWYDEKSTGDAPETPIDVNLGDLAKFAKEITTERGRLAGNWEEGIQPLLLETGTSFGFSGLNFPETYRLRHLYSLAQQAAGQFYAEAMQGLTAIAWAAETIAIEYEDGDLEGKEGLDAVYDSFSPEDRSRSLAAQTAELTEEAESADEPPPTSESGVPWYMEHSQDPGAGQPGADEPYTGPSTLDHPPPDGTTVSEGEQGEYTIPDDPYNYTPELTGKVP